MESAERKLVRQTQRLGLPILDLYYEEILIDRDTVMKKIFDFLEVPYVETAGHYFKNTPDNLRSILLNFDEVEKELKGTPYERRALEVLSPV